MGRTYSNHTEWKGKKQNKVTVKVRKKKGLTQETPALLQLATLYGT